MRQAQEAKARRDAERLRRERRIEAALADFYEATGTAEQIRAAAQRKAARVVEEGETAARESDAAACKAVRELRALVETNAEVADLCGVAASAVRAMLAEPAAGHAAADGAADRAA